MNELGTLTLQEVAISLGTSEETLNRLAILGEIPATKFDESWIFLHEDVIAFLRMRIKKETAERRASNNSGAITKEPSKRRGTKRKQIPSLEDLQALAAAHGIVVPE